ncbi:MAG TPA: NAD(P)H-dependent oxidoreductase [Gemmatimonadales bacterium]|nr:NAD(P)H-dependent oxidoreductase [Gemmatimonadales bacterium]
MRLLALAASLREGSLNRKLLRVAADLARARGAEVVEHHFSEFTFPNYDGDVEKAHGVPDEVKRASALVESVDGLLLASPEYNFSLPGTLKNGIDWLSRIKPTPLRGRWALLMSASNGPIGGIRGLWQLRIPLEGLGMFVHPDMYILPQATEAFDEAGRLKEAPRHERLEKLVAEYVATVRKARA